MSSNKPVKNDVSIRAERSVANAVEWGNRFLQRVEHEFRHAAERFSDDATREEFRQAMSKAFKTTLVESVQDPKDISYLIEECVTQDLSGSAKLSWTAEHNARRIELIDKMLQQSLTSDEEAELCFLTSLLRSHVDNEDFVPLEAARQLHGRLLEQAKGARVKDDF